MTDFQKIEHKTPQVGEIKRTRVRIGEDEYEVQSGIGTMIIRKRNSMVASTGKRIDYWQPVTILSEIGEVLDKMSHK
jgi:hypothetical protein